MTDSLFWQPCKDMKVNKLSSRTKWSIQRSCTLSKITIGKQLYLNWDSQYVPYLQISSWLVLWGCCWLHLSVLEVMTWLGIWYGTVVVAKSHLHLNQTLTDCYLSLQNPTHSPAFRKKDNHARPKKKQEQVTDKRPFKYHQTTNKMCSLLCSEVVFSNKLKRVHLR